MSTQRTWSFEDKAAWGDGPWQREPDKTQWVDEATGLVCLTRRGPTGAWCGYVGVSEGHPLHGVAYSDCPQECGETWCEHSPESILSVHGGVTYSDFCDESDPEHGICHVPEPNRPDRLFWFGFDCAHLGDLSPAWNWLDSGFPAGKVYRNLAYAQAECSQLAAQLHAMKKGEHR